MTVIKQVMYTTCFTQYNIMPSINSEYYKLKNKYNILDLGLSGLAR